MAKKAQRNQAVLTISPTPPVQKGSMTVTVQGGRPGMVLTVEFDPGGTQQWTVGQDGTASGTVPGNATSVWVSAPGAVSAQSVVAPAP